MLEVAQCGAAQLDRPGKHGLDLIDQFLEGRTRIGAVDAQLQAAEQRIANRSFELESHLSNVRDVDLAEVVSSLTREEAALRASLETMSRLLPPSLMDFLR